MNVLERNLNLIVRIVHYCEDISEAIERFGNSHDELIKDKAYKNAVSMCVLQIGELTVNLTEDFKEKYNNVPWRQIRAMRNVAAHDYDNMKTDYLWKTISEDIPELSKYCEKILKENNISEYSV